MNKKSIRILCIGAHNEPSNAYRRVLAFQKLGHEVQTINLSNLGYFKRSLLRKIALRLVGGFLSHSLSNKIWGEARSFNPNIIWFEKNLLMNGQQLQVLKKRIPVNTKLVHYNPDDPFGKFHGKLWDNFIGAIPFYDVHFVPKEQNVAEYRNLGAKRVYAFDRSFDPDLHRPIELTSEEKTKFGCEVGFIGTWAPHRESVIAELIKRGIPVAVWGGGWHNGKHWLTIKPHWRGPNQVGDDYAKAICGMDIALHFLRHENRDEQDSRTFEIPACGTFMLAERSPAHERLFEDGKEAIFFDSVDDLEDKLRFYMKKNIKRKPIATAAYKRVVNPGCDHISRLRQLINIIEN